MRTFEAILPIAIKVKKILDLVQFIEGKNLFESAN